jgi:TRAP-type uncharacterized transport system substrate-binding protein
MHVKIFNAVLFILLTSVGPASITGAPQRAPEGYERLQEELERLEQEQTQTLRKWRRSGQEHIPSLQSPLVHSEYLSGRLPSECIAHLEAEKAQLEQSGYSKQAWLQHVFMCEKCCAPLFADVMDMHVSYVIANPHLVVLFDFDTDTIKPSYQPRLDAFMQQFDSQHDQLLLIGRASKIGHRAYNVALSGSRAVEIKDYVINKFDIDDERIHYLFFGADPPHLTLNTAADYGITAEDIAAIDTQLRNRAENKVNQSVVIVINKDSDDAVAPHTTSAQVAHEDRQEARAPTQTPAVSEDTKPPPTDTGRELDTARPAGREGEDAASPPRPDRLIMVTEAPTSTSFRFGLDVMRVGRNIGLDMELQQSDGGIDTIERLRGSPNPAVGVVPSDMPGIMSQSPDAEMNRLAEQLHLLFPLYPEEVHLFAHKDIQRVEDLDGKRIIVGVQGSRTWLTAHHLLYKLKVQPAELIDSVSPLKSIVAVLRGTADAMFYVGDKPALPFLRMRNLLGDDRYASLLQDVNFVQLNPEQAGQEYIASTLGPQDYTWMKTTVPTIAVQMVLASFDASRPAAHPDDRYCGQLVHLTQAVRDNFNALQHAGHSKWQEVDPDNRLAAWKYHSCTPSETAR